MWKMAAMMSSLWTLITTVCAAWTSTDRMSSTLMHTEQTNGRGCKGCCGGVPLSQPTDLPFTAWISASTLGPTLFLIYINDISSAVREGESAIDLTTSILSLFEDDTKWGRCVDRDAGQVPDRDRQSDRVEQDLAAALQH